MNKQSTKINFKLWLEYEEVDPNNWEIEKIEILTECFTYGFVDEKTFNKQSYILTFLLAKLQDESERLDIFENSSEIILKGEPKPIELLNSIINWISTQT